MSSTKVGDVDYNIWEKDPQCGPPKLSEKEVIAKGKALGFNSGPKYVWNIYYGKGGSWNITNPLKGTCHWIIRECSRAESLDYDRICGSKIVPVKDH